MRWNTLTFTAVAVLGLAQMGWATAPADGDGKTVILANYLNRDIPFSAVAVDSAALYQALDIPVGTPFTAGDVPVRLEGKQLIFHAALSAGELRRLPVAPAADWMAADALLRVGPAAISNGILAAGVGGDEFELALSTGKILGNLSWSGGVSYDRLASKHNFEWIRPSAFSISAEKGKGGEVTLRAETGRWQTWYLHEPGTRSLRDGVLDGSPLHVVVKMTILPHQPIAEYRIRITNPGDKTIYLCDSSVGGRFGGLMSGELALREPSGKGSMDFKDRDFSHPTYTELPLDRGWAQRPRRWGHNPYCAVVSPDGYALGVSALDYYGPIWMNSERWTFQPGGFELRAIAKGEHLPIELAPGKSVEVGNYFYCFSPCSLAFEETFTAYRTLRNGDRPSVNASPAVLVGRQVVKPQLVNEAEWTRLAPGAVLGVRVNLADNPLLRAKSGWGQAGCRVSLFETGTAAAIPPEGGEVQTPLTELLDARKQDAKAMASGAAVPRDVTLIVEGPDDLAVLAIGPAPAPPPVPEMPTDGMEITDIASSLRWRMIPGRGKYEIEVANDPDFNDVTLRDAARLNEVNYGHYQCLQPFSPGVHYWRVRAQGGMWSTAQTFRVTGATRVADPACAPPAGEPFFTFWMDPEAYCSKYGENPIPEALRGNSTLITYLDSDGGRGKSIRRDTKHAAKQDVRIAYRSLCLADIEWAFQNLPNVTGYVDGENLSSLFDMRNDATTPTRLTRRQAFRLIRLCAKYGKYFIFGDGGMGYAALGRDEEWLRLMSECGANVLLGYKTNITDYMHAAADSNMGLYLTGVFPNYYYETENWYWDHAGFRELGTQFGQREGHVEMCPAMFANLQVLAGLARGAGGFKVDSYLSKKGGRVEDNFELTRINLPFFKALIEHKMVPAKEDVLEKVKVGVVLPSDPQLLSLAKSWGAFDALYRATYTLGTHSFHNENWPDNSRYYFIPLLPAGTASVPGIERIVALEELDTVEKVKAVFDPLYPPIEGDAFRAVVGNKIFVMPGRENEDAIYSYRIPLRQTGIEGLEGRIGPMEYLIGKLGDDGRSLWIMSDAVITRWEKAPEQAGGSEYQPIYEYPQTTFAVRCSEKPSFQVTPASALVSSAWADGRLVLTLKHDTAPAQVNITVP